LPKLELSDQSRIRVAAAPRRFLDTEIGSLTELLEVDYERFDATKMVH
jgi:hypothetical protein